MLILTVTVRTPEGMESSHMYTYLLAIGKSRDDHTRVTEHFMEEARELMKGSEYYSFKTNQTKWVAFGISTWNANRPEHQCLTHTRKEGTYGRCLDGRSMCRRNICQPVLTATGIWYGRCLMVPQAAPGNATSVAIGVLKQIPPVQPMGKCLTCK